MAWNGGSPCLSVCLSALGSSTELPRLQITDDLHVTESRSTYIGGLQHLRIARPPAVLLVRQELLVSTNTMAAPSRRLGMRTSTASSPPNG